MFELGRSFCLATVRQASTDLESLGISRVKYRRLIRQLGRRYREPTVRRGQYYVLRKVTWAKKNIGYPMRDNTRKLSRKSIGIFRVNSTSFLHNGISGFVFSRNLAENTATKLDPFRRDVAEKDVFVNKDAIGDRKIFVQIYVIVVC
jgi:hypothetical protein